jgi:hypothetical protein
MKIGKNREVIKVKKVIKIKEYEIKEVMKLKL